MCDGFKDPVTNVHFQEWANFGFVGIQKNNTKEELSTSVICGAHHSVFS